MATVIMHVLSTLLYINISVTPTRIIRLDNFYKHNVVPNRIKYHVTHTLYATYSYLPGNAFFSLLYPNAK